MIKFISIIIAVFTVNYVYAQDGIVKVAQDAFELYSVGNFGEAALIFEETALMMRKNADSDIKGRMKVSLYTGLSFKEIGEYQKAYLWITDAFNLAVAYGDKPYAVKILANIAETQRMQGLYSKSIENYMTAINSGIVDNTEKAALYYGLAESYRLAAKYDEALEACIFSKQLSKSTAMEKLYLSCNIVEGEVYRMKGDYAESLHMFGVALDMGRARNYPDIVVAALNGLGLVSETLGRIDVARNKFEEALSLSVKNEDFDRVVLISEKIISLIPNKGSFLKKGDYIFETVKFLEPLKDSQLNIVLLKLSFEYYKASAAYDKMLIVGTAIYSESVSTNNNYEASQALYGIALALYKTGKYTEALDKLNEATSKLSSNTSEEGLDKIVELRNKCLSEIESLNKTTDSQSLDNSDTFKE